MICDQTQKRFKKPVKSVLFIECLNVARVLKLVSSGSLFQAFITRSHDSGNLSRISAKISQNGTTIDVII